MPTYAVSGKRSAAEQILNQMHAASARRYLAPFGFAVVYAGLGEKEQALSWLERACEVGDYRLNRLKVDPRLASLRLDPHYQDLLRRMNLPQ